jgi:two-component system, LuxR family, sensor kinase FixL
MGQMATGIAHELNQPLAAATNYLSAAKRIIAGSGDTAKTADYVDKASDQVKRAAEIIQRIRHFARKGEPDRRAERLSKLLEEASGVALIGAKERGVKVTTHIASDLPDVLVDRVQIQQVIVNLIRNAIDAMESSSVRELTLEANPYAERVIVRVTDTGRGIAPDVAQRLFEPFVTTKKQGMGVGLAICQSIIRGHGGEIWAEPNPEGGASFLFTLPQA